MSCPEHSRPAKRRKAYDGHTNALPDNRAQWLFLLPLDVWPMVRDLAGAREANSWKSVCRQFKTLVTAPEFWEHFRFEFRLDLESHRQIFLLFGPVCRTTKVSLDSLSIPALANQTTLAPLVSGLTVTKLRIEEPLPEILSKFSVIRGLTLYKSNRATNECLRQLQSPAQLTTLCLEFSMITDADLQAALLGFTQLERLGLTWCIRLTDSTLRFLTRLKTLDINSCSAINGQGLRGLPLQQLDVCQKYWHLFERMQVLTTLHHLERLRLCELTDSQLGILAQIRTLRHLDLLECRQVTGTGLSVLNALTLQTLKITLTGCHSQALRNLPGFPTAVELKLQDCHLTSEDLLSLQACSGLTKLYLFKCRAIGDLAVLRRLPVLQSLSLSELRTDNTQLAGLQHCAVMRELFLDQCPHITDLAALQKCRSLRKITGYYLRKT